MFVDEELLMDSVSVNGKIRRQSQANVRYYKINIKRFKPTPGLIKREQIRIRPQADIRGLRCKSIDKLYNFYITTEIHICGSSLALLE